MSHTVTVTRTTTSTTSAIILNTGYVKSIPGLLKLAEVILGGFALVLLYLNRYDLCTCWIIAGEGKNIEPLYFLATVHTFFLASLLLLISCLLSISTGPIIAKTNFEFIYHGAGFIFLLIASGFLLLDDHKNSSSKDQFVIASILGLIMAAFYLLSSIWGYRSYRGP